MIIGLHDADKNKFPNYALMKLSAYHKSLGDEVEMWNPGKNYDKIYSSKVFTFPPPQHDALKALSNVVYGGTGYGIYDELPPEVDSMFPDYSIYPDCDHAIGFLTRGCIRKCPWCVVPRKEGMIRPYRTWQEIKRPDSRDIVLMDNNVLAIDYGIQQMESMIGEKVRIDFNQGLDARLITSEVAEIISRLKWIRFIRMSCDTESMLDIVLDRIELMKKHGIKPYRFFVYVLVQDIESAERRVITLRKVGADPFAQPYRDFENNIEPTREQRDFARWVNHKAIFKSVDTFADYKRSKSS